MGFPLGDWQFWIVTAGMMVAVWVVVRPFLRRSGPKGAAPCAGCKHASPAAVRGAGGGDGAGERLVTLGKLR